MPMKFPTNMVVTISEHNSNRNTHIIKLGFLKGEKEQAPKEKNNKEKREDQYKEFYLHSVLRSFTAELVP